MIILLKLIFIIWKRRKPQWWQPKHILTFMQISHSVRILCKSNLVYFVVYTGRYFVLSLSYYVTKMTWLEPQPWIFFLDLWAVQPNTVLYTVYIYLQRKTSWNVNRWMKDKYVHYIYTIHIFPTDNPMKTRYSISTGYCFETASTEIHVNIHHTNIQQCLHVCSLCNQWYLSEQSKYFLQTIWYSSVLARIGNSLFCTFALRSFATVAV